MWVSACKGLLVLLDRAELKIQQFWFWSFFQHLSQSPVGNLAFAFSSICATNLSHFTHPCAGAKHPLRATSSHISTELWNWNLKSEIFILELKSETGRSLCGQLSRIYFRRQLVISCFKSSKRDCLWRLRILLAPFLWAAWRIPNNRPLWPEFSM